LTRTFRLPTGAEGRIRNEDAARAAVLVNGGTSKPLPGTWSATSEWLAVRLAPQFRHVAFLEVRYRTRSWRQLDSCIEDAESALDTVGRPTLLVGFSMGGAVAISTAADPRVVSILGLAPWIPEELDVVAVAGKRVDVVHGAWDRPLPGVPGVSPSHSRAGFERLLASGARGSYVLVPRGLHGVAVRSRRGGLVTLPGAERWLSPVSAALERFSAA
jgi:pimeloyl-ACP methyl ester carboxylesterase